MSAPVMLSQQSLRGLASAADLFGLDDTSRTSPQLAAAVRQVARGAYHAVRRHGLAQTDALLTAASHTEEGAPWALAHRILWRGLDIPVAAAETSVEDYLHATHFALAGLDLAAMFFAGPEVHLPLARRSLGQRGDAAYTALVTSWRPVRLPDELMPQLAAWRRRDDALIEAIG